MKVLTIFGAQGSGKGTQAFELSSIYSKAGFKVRTFDMGAEMSRQRKSGPPNELGLATQEFINRGELVPDWVPNRMFAEWIEQLACNGWPQILIPTGVPRTISQIIPFFSAIFAQEAEFWGAVHLKIDDEVAISRIAGRLVCSLDPEHVTNTKESMPGLKCQYCEGSLIKRTDDMAAAAVKERLHQFRRHTIPTIHVFHALGQVHEIETSELSIPQVTLDILIKFNPNRK